MTRAVASPVPGRLTVVRLLDASDAMNAAARRGPVGLSREVTAVDQFRRGNALLALLQPAADCDRLVYGLWGDHGGEVALQAPAATRPLCIPRTKVVHTDWLPRNWSIPDRLLATLPARLASTPRVVELSHTAVEARRLDSQADTPVVVLNWVGEPIDALAVTLLDVSARRMTSLRHGSLDGRALRAASVQVRLALDDVDVLLFEP
jgi:hypothetical protein